MKTRAGWTLLAMALTVLGTHGVSYASAPAKAAVSATAIFEGWKGSYITATLALYMPGDSLDEPLREESVRMQTGGFIGLSNLDPGVYRVCLLAGGYQTGCRNLTLAPHQNADVDFGQLRSGDLNGDGRVDLADFSLLSTNWESEGDRP